MIRCYHPTDLDDLLSVWAAATVVAHPFLSVEFLRRERHRIPSVYLPNAETWIWEAQGRVVGFASLLGNEVGALFVHPSCHRAGIGRALMDRARTLRGELEVEVFKANAQGRAFYADYGFELMEAKIHAQTGFEILRLRLAA